MNKKRSGDFEVEHWYDLWWDEVEEVDEKEEEWQEFTV